MNEIKTYLETELTLETVRPMARLACRSFESSTTEDERIARMLAAVGSNDPEKISGRAYAIWDGARVVAFARTFVRTVHAAQSPIPVLALASVCTEPEIRGQGLGARIVRAAFERVGLEPWPDVSLFQTPVAQFYEKLDCRIVSNRFVNLRNAVDPEAKPWRDDTVMIYPGDFNWPEGIIDMNGPDY